MGAAYAATTLLTAVAIGWTAWTGVAEPATAAAFGALVTVGEATRIPLPGDREAAPLATAGALAYALLGETDGSRTSHGVLQVVAVVVVAAALGRFARALPCARRAVPRAADAGDARSPDHAARRVLAVAFAATCFQPLHNSGLLVRFLDPGPLYALFLFALLALTALCDAVLAAVLATARTGHPFTPVLRDELRALATIGSAVCAGGVVMALAVGVAGLWALPVFSLPLLLTQASFRRHAAIRATYRQTIASLARATEVAGYTPAGHARRVTALSREVGRELGMAQRELLLLEYAALMHDIGQLSLVDPVPGGATEPLASGEQRRIALLGGVVVRQTGVPAEVAVIVESQADPYREQPLAGRIVRAVNAYEDLTGGSAALERRLAAVERLRLSTARDYDPAVVRALTRVLARGGAGGPPGGNGR
ncbi:HD domain-containing protein [Streptomyces sp. H39-S7]|uniref:HD domain-containing protein n=1 Tax=Streptomyces sp. H39-S7 TaxID=3004357 RepID=UPI0022AFAE03|nr:HD domain-containing protein [Streptomyces sp. H39-S7]MCZ4120157.1 HD domain-containing protein [Streptomyces sp. H39-S7]